MPVTLCRLSWRRAAVALVPFAVAALALAPAATAQAPKTEGVSAKTDGAAVLAPLYATLIAAPEPVVGADGNRHLAYELVLNNAADAPINLTSVIVRGGGQILTTMQGEGLASMVRTGGSVPANGSTFMWLDVVLPAAAKVPSRLLHQFSFTVGELGGETPVRSVSFTGVPVRPGTEAPVVVDAPLRGGGWIIGNGCCAPPTAHRGAILPINGTPHVAERFAIDFVQIGANGALAQGDPAQNGSFGYFGDPIHSVAAGRVVNTQNGLPEETPGALPAGATIQTAGGNYVVVDIGQGRYAFYAHMQPGSLTVKVGDRVKAGTVLGRLGNTGNTDAAHLHFHIMDGPSPLLSNGLPFVFREFTGQGVVSDEQALASPAQPIPVDRSALAGVHRRQLPLNLQVVSFPG